MCAVEPGKDELAPVFDYRALNDALFEIASRRYAGKQRKADTYADHPEADGAIPYTTIVSIMAAMRCKLPDFGKEAHGVRAADRGRAAEEGARSRSRPTGKLYDTAARHVRPEEDGAVPRHPVLVGVRMSVNS